MHIASALRCVALGLAGVEIIDGRFQETGVGAFVHSSALSSTPRHGLFPRPRQFQTRPGARGAAICTSRRADGPPPRRRWGGSVRTLTALEPAIAPGIMAAVAATTAAAAAWRARSKAEITVRRAREADFEGVAGIRGMLVPVGMSGATGFLGGKVVIDDPEEAKRRVLMAKVADLVRREAVALIALERGLIVGTVDCIMQPLEQRLDDRAEEDRNTPRTRVFLKNVFVLPEHRRRGVARRLVKGAEEFARREGAEALCLQVDQDNAPARELYLACGFEETEEPGPRENGWGGALLHSLGMGKLYMYKRV